MVDVIERNLFERYGDVQAFTRNAAVLDRSPWRSQAADNRTVGAMNATAVSPPRWSRARTMR